MRRSGAGAPNRGTRTAFHAVLNARLTALELGPSNRMTQPTPLGKFADAPQDVTAVGERWSHECDQRFWFDLPGDDVERGDDVISGEQTD